MTSGRAQYKIKVATGGREKKKLRYIEDVWLIADLPVTSEEEEDGEVYRPLTLQEAGILGHDCWAPGTDGSIEAGTVRGKLGNRFLFVPHDHQPIVGSVDLDYGHRSDTINPRVRVVHIQLGFNCLIGGLASVVHPCARPIVMLSTRSRRLQVEQL
jgi:hypothetical protein